MSRIMQEIGQYHQARMNQAIVDADEADSQSGMSGAEDTPGILSILFADVQEKGFILSKSWGELLGSLSKYQGKLMVTENGYAERERRLKEQEEKIKQQTGSWPEEVVQLKSDLTCKENSLVACQTELVHVNKMAELVDVEHSRTKEILEDVMRGKTAMEAKCAQYEMDLNAMSQKLQAAQEELEIKDQLVVKLEQQMVKEIAEGMTEITSLKGLVESREDLLEDEKKAHNETNIKLRQLQIAYQALKRNLDCAGQYGLHMPMLSYHDNPHTMLSSQNKMTHYTSPGPSNVQLWRPVSNVVGAPPAKVRRVVTNTSRTEMYHLDDIAPQFPLHHGLFDFDSSSIPNITEISSPRRPFQGRDDRFGDQSENIADDESDIVLIADPRGKKTSTNIGSMTSSVLQGVRSRIAAFKEQLKRRRATDSTNSSDDSCVLQDQSHALLNRRVSTPTAGKQPSVERSVDVDSQTRKTRRSFPNSVNESKTRSSAASVPESPVKSCSVVLNQIQVEKISPSKPDPAKLPLKGASRCKPAICSICGDALLSNALYIAHAKKAHRGIDVFKCKDCGKVFPDPYFLNSHYNRKLCFK